MAPDAKNSSLIYVSDEGTSDVYVYSLTTYRLVGVLTGFSEPRGICVDKARDIWIADAGDSNVLEYAHGGSQPIAVLADSGQYPVACSVERTTGGLAAANIISAKDGPGSISIYPNAAGSPTVIPAFSHTYTTAYDPHGNLFIDGANNVGWPQFGELPRGQQAVTNLTLVGGTIAFPGGMQYVHGSLALGDVQGPNGNAVIYQVGVSGTTLTVTGTTKSRHANFVVAFFILGRRVICLNAEDGPRVANYIAIYKYPEGGEPLRTIHNSAFSIPVGLAVSV